MADWNLPTASTRVTQSADELCIMLRLPDEARKAIHGWVLEQDWPEGTDLHEPEKYHITLMYTPSGHVEHRDADWIEHMKTAEVRIVGIDVFTQDDEGRYPYVLRLHAPEVKKHAEEMQRRAERDHGLEITHFPGGYKPHITVGYGPEESVAADDVVELEFHAGPSFVSPPRGDKGGDSKTTATRTAASLERGEIVWNLDGLHGDNITHLRTAVKAPIPPGLRDASGKDRCGNCKMFDRAQEVCWGYGNRGAADDPPVTEYKVCDSYSPAPGYHQASDGSQILDDLSLKSVAHNLHYKYEQGTIDPAELKSYAERLLDMVGYPRDDMTTMAALQAWQTMYPGDRVLEGPRGAGELPQASATTPTKSWGYGTVSGQRPQDLIQLAHVNHTRIHHGAAYAGVGGDGGRGGLHHGVAPQQQPDPGLPPGEWGGEAGQSEPGGPVAAGGPEDGVGLLAGSRTARRGSLGWTSPELDSILDAFNRSHGVTLLANEDPSQVSFDHIDIPPENRGNGVGRRVMQQLKAYADRSGKQLNVQHVVNYPFFAGLGWMQFRAPDQFTYSPSTAQEPYVQEGSTEPTPTDRWPDHGQRPEDEQHSHDVQFSNDWV